MKFYLGTHEPSWLRRLDVPLFVCHRRLRRYRTWPRARGPWALDSGGFSELAEYGEWRTSETEYAETIAAAHVRIGRLMWAAPQDWMCEPWIVEKTGKTVEWHQQATIESFLSLNRTVYGTEIIPVLQGWTLADYERHVEAYDAEGIDLRRSTVVGLGSVCRRQATAEIAAIAERLAGFGISLHGFGVKADGLNMYGRFLTSADSLAWSLNARRNPPLPGCSHRSCANCMHWALRWRERVLDRCATQQPTLWEAAA